jgi:dynein heavy chain
MYIPEFSGENLEKIFSSILEWGFSAHPPDILKSSKKITKITINLYNKVIENLLPLPSKPHYTFNLR